MRIAYLILAYDQPRHFGRLVEQLDDGNAKFFIHVDRKSEIALFRREIASERATFLNERLSINWGGWRMVQATLNMLRLAHTEGTSDYYHLLSASFYPIKSNRQITAKLQAEALNYMTINHELTPGSKHFWWVHRYHWPDLLPMRPRGRFHKFARRLQHRLRPRRLPCGLRPYKGWQWWCLSRECVDYVLGYIESHPEVVRFFRYTCIPDETFFHTIIGNSKFADTLSPGFEEESITGNHYIRWHHGVPCVLKADAFATLIESDACFARKFHETDSLQLVGMLREFWRTGHATTEREAH